VVWWLAPNFWNRGRRGFECLLCTGARVHRVVDERALHGRWVWGPHGMAPRRGAWGVPRVSARRVKAW
jgi:hypothetical protein